MRDEIQISDIYTFVVMILKKLLSHNVRLADSSRRNIHTAR